MTTELSVRRLMGWLWGISVLVLGLNYAHASQAIMHDIRLWNLPMPWLNIDGEASLSSWYASSLLLLASVLMLWSSLAERAKRRPTALGWLILSIGFVYLSIDESSMIHESLAALTAGFAADLPIFRHRWVIVALPVVLLAGALFVPFLLKLPRATALRLIAAGAVYVGGALGMEMINGAVLVAEGQSGLYVALICVEETMEVLGILLAIRTVALHIAALDASPLKLTAG